MKPIRYSFNPYFQSQPSYSESFFSEDVLKFHQSLKAYAPTPLVELPDLARRLGVERILIKDESKRFGLNAFKALGASYAVYCFLSKKWRELFNEPMEFDSLFSADSKDKFGKITFTTATDGNHGLALAWTAMNLKQDAVIFVPDNMVQARKENILATGARLVVVDGNYDETVARAATEGDENGWQVISDTGYPGYMEIPKWIMTGYSTLFREIDASLSEKQISQPDFLFMQAGVGGMAGAGVDYYVKKDADHCPKIVCVEPLDADCLLESIISGGGGRAMAKGKQDSIMAGLNCGTVSQLAWPVVKQGIEFYLGIDDEWSRRAMRTLYAPEGGDAKVISGESGAAGLAGLMALCQENESQEVRNKLGLDKNSTILLINTEGDTDPDRFQKIVQSEVVRND